MQPKEGKVGYSINDITHVLLDKTREVAGRSPAHPLKKPLPYNHPYLYCKLQRVRRDAAERLAPVWVEPEKIGRRQRLYSTAQALVIIDELELLSERRTARGRNLRDFFQKPAEVFNAARHHLENPQPKR